MSKKRKRTKRINLDLDPRVHRALKLEAVRRGVTLKELMFVRLTARLRWGRRRRRRKPRVPEVPS